MLLNIFVLSFRIKTCLFFLKIIKSDVHFGDKMMINLKSSKPLRTSCFSVAVIKYSPCIWTCGSSGLEVHNDRGGIAAGSGS